MSFCGSDGDQYVWAVMVVHFIHMVVQFMHLTRHHCVSLELATLPITQPGLKVVQSLQVTTCHDFHWNSQIHQQLGRILGGAILALHNTSLSFTGTSIFINNSDHDVGGAIVAANNTSLSLQWTFLLTIQICRAHTTGGVSCVELARKVTVLCWALLNANSALTSILSCSSLLH